MTLEEAAMKTCGQAAKMTERRRGQPKEAAKETEQSTDEQDQAPHSESVQAPKKKMSPVLVRGNTTQLINTLIDDLHAYGQHIFNAFWQSKQFEKAVDTFQDGTIVQVLDFAQNYLCILQDEAQGTHTLESPAGEIAPCSDIL